VQTAYRPVSICFGKEYRHDQTPKSRLAAAALPGRLAAAAGPAGLLDDDEARRAILDLRAKVDAITRDLNTRSTPSRTRPPRSTC
jgi:hypothetical protein